MFVYLIEISFFRIPIFGICVALGLIGAIEIFKRLTSVSISTRQAEGLASWSILGGLIGAKVWYELFYSEMPFSSFDLSEGISGLVFHGGFLTGTLTFIFLVIKNNFPIKLLLDSAALSVIFAYAVGRLGCQLSGDGDYGIPTNSFIGIVYPSGTVPTLIPVYPTPLFESFVSILGFIILNKYFGNRVGSGKMTGLVLMWMGFSRFFIEFIRPNPVFFAGLTDAQLFSIFITSIGLIIQFR